MGDLCPSSLPSVATVFWGMSLNVRALIFTYEMRIYSVVKLCDECFYFLFQMRKGGSKKLSARSCTGSHIGQQLSWDALPGVRGLPRLQKQCT